MSMVTPPWKVRGAIHTWSSSAESGMSGTQLAGAPVAGQASGQAMSFQTATYAEASISVETVAANLGAVFSAIA